MNKAQELELTIQQMIDALIKAGAKAVGTPQVVEVRTNESGYIDIPMKVRIAV